MERNHYDVLGIGQKASQKEVRKAYLKFSLKYHPDKNKEVGSEEKFKTIGRAYEVLIDVEKRGNFDRLLKSHVFKCKQCFAIFEENDELVKHFQKFHPIHCNFCVVSFENYSKLDLHNKKYHQKTFKCKNCAKIFWNPDDLNIHKEELHSFKCQV